MSQKQQAIGFINFDSGGAESTEIEIRVPKDRIKEIRRGQYVRIESVSASASTNFFARVSRGPFFVPDAVSKDSAYARAAILQADTVKFSPDYHAVCYAQVLSELDMERMRTVGSFARPHPQSRVYPLTSEEIQRLLELEGDMFMGELEGYQGVRVKIPSNKNAALPRNVGIFGTVGSGKTNTSQVLIEEASAAGWAVIVLDIEGEYVRMDNPSTQRSLDHLFKRFGVKPGGIRDLDVYHVINTDSAREDISRPFSILFSNLRPDILAEILGLTDAQNERFLDIYFDLAQTNEGERRGTRARSGFVHHLMDRDDNERPPLGITLQDIVDRVETILEQNAAGGRAPAGGRASFFVLARKLRKLQRYDIFDHEENLGDYSGLLAGGKVSVIDLSGSYSNIVNNIVITDLLRSLFDLKRRDKDGKLPPVMIVIEEAHSYISKENASKMEETLDVLREISRRGRKRWVSLCFISQQPSHLPPEIYELCNTRFVHQTTGGRNLDAIKTSTGAVDPAVWDDVPRLGQGTCLFVSSYFKNRPMFVNVRPCMSERRHVEE
jgi:DNA helicase HerA-like ATPase